MSFKIFDAVLRNANLPVLVAGTATHDAARDLSAAMVRAGADNETITAVVEAALPDGYSGDTLTELPAMIDGARTKGFGEVSTAGKAERARGRDVTSSAVETLIRTADLFHDGSKQYMSVPTEAGGQVTLLIRGQAAQKWIRKHCFEELGKNIGGRDLTEIVEHLTGHAEFKGQQRKVFRRFARPDDRTIYLDLGTNDGSVVEITAEDWSIRQRTPVAFVRDDHALPMPLPERGGDMDELREVLGLDRDGWILLLGFLMNCFRARGPFFCLIVEGQPASGKTTLCRLVKRLIDPRDADGSMLPSDNRDLMLIASKSYMPVFDNVSGMKRDISDTLCRIATGGAIETRTLYSDEGTTVIRASAPFIINGIGDFVHRADLLDRAIPLRLRRPAVRKDEDGLVARFEEARARLLGALCDATVHALRSYDSIKPSQDIRMIDAVRWITAAEPRLGLKPGTFARLLAEHQSAAAADRVTAHPLFPALLDLIKKEPFCGTPTELYEALSGDRRRIDLPRDAAALSRRLNDLEPQLAHAGILIEEGKRRANKRTVIVRTTDQTVPETNQKRPDPLNRPTREEG